VVYVAECHSDPSSAAEVLADAEERGLSVRELTAEQGVHVAPDRHSQRPASPAQVHAALADPQVREEGLQDPGTVEALTEELVTQPTRRTRIRRRTTGPTRRDEVEDETAGEMDEEEEIYEDPEPESGRPASRPRRNITLISRDARRALAVIGTELRHPDDRPTRGDVDEPGMLLAQLEKRPGGISPVFR
jgi:hypothetical protein